MQGIIGKEEDAAWTDEKISHLALPLVMVRIGMCNLFANIERPQDIEKESESYLDKENKLARQIETEISNAHRRRGKEIYGAIY